MPSVAPTIHFQRAAWNREQAGSARETIPWALLKKPVQKRGALSAVQMPDTVPQGNGI